jgi:hypothetical protein
MPLAERQSRGQRALRYGLDNFGLERNVDQFEALLEQIAAERRTTPAT